MAKMASAYGLLSLANEARNCVSHSPLAQRAHRRDLNAEPLGCHDFPFKIVADHPGLVRDDA
jgi:hypothetical protein